MPREVAYAARLFLSGCFIGLFVVLFLIWGIGLAFGQGGGSSDYWADPRIRVCCSEADALYADDWRVLPDGSVLARVTGGGPRNHEWAPIGREYIVPPERVVDVPGNPTGRPLLFISRGTLGLFCFAMGPMG